MNYYSVYIYKQGFSPPIYPLSLKLGLSLSLSREAAMYNLRGRTKSLLLFLLTSVLALILLLSETHFGNSPKTTTPPLIHIHKHLQVAHSACEGTLYPELCVSTLASFPDLTSKSLPQIISSTVNHTIFEVRASSYNCTRIERQLRTIDPIQKRAIEDCIELFEHTLVELNQAVSDLTSNKIATRHYHDLQTLLSAAMTNQYTCLDGFAFSKGNVRDYIDNNLYGISNHVSNSLAMLKKISGHDHKSNSEVFPEYGRMKNGFPNWVSSKDQKLLLSSVNKTKYNLVVAKDGTGNFTTISEAVEAAPNSSTTRSLTYS